MNLPSGLLLSFEEPLAGKDAEAVDDALAEYCKAFIADTTFTHFGLLVRDDSGEIRAGLDAYVYAGWLSVHNLWVAADLRRRGIGGGLMAEAESRARMLRCHSVRLDTFSFEAPEFYRKLGYQEYARLDYPPDHQRIFFKKQLIAE
jgi:GNAT superfamily N-acetyltransferase